YLIREAGGIVLSAEGFNGLGFGDRINRAVKDEMSQEELEAISRRTRATLASRRKKRQTYCRRDYCSKKVSLLDGLVVESCTRRKHDEDFKLVPIPEEQKIIDFIISQREEHGLSWESIANELNKNKVPPPDPRRTGIWHHTSTKSIYRT